VARLAALTSSALAFSLLVAACGGSGSSNVAQLATTATTATAAAAATGTAGQEQALLDFSGCMRGHGIPAFPDPQRSASGTYGFSNLPALAQLVRGHQQALDACLPLLAKAGITSPANLAAFQQGMLAFAKCMRSHGVPGFPDPGANGRFAGKLKALDRSAPSFQHALTSCRPKLQAAVSVFGVG
jgi:hypothetical protein